MVYVPAYGTENTSARNIFYIGAQQLQHRGATIAAKGRSNCGKGMQQFPSPDIIPDYYRHRARRQATDG
jgi:hypothetical protein